jgi:hypothetical protein
MIDIYKTKEIESLLKLESFRSYFTIHQSKIKSSGLKISIQGKTIDDSLFLIQRLHNYLVANDIAFKVASQKCYNLAKNSDLFSKEQSHKSMTIYHNENIDFKNLCNDVYELIKDYKGWYDINTPTSYEHYAGGLFVRNSYDENGQYMRALRE